MTAYLLFLLKENYPLQYSCLENPMGKGAWRAIVHRVTHHHTQLKRLRMHLKGVKSDLHSGWWVESRLLPPLLAQISLEARKHRKQDK